MSDRALFSPFEVGPYRLRNRIVMAPMARARCGPGRAPGPIVGTYYAQRASAAFIVTEATHVSADTVSREGTPGIHTQEQTLAWSRVTAAVHEAGGLVFQQIYHLGRKQHRSFLPGQQAPIAPSAIAACGRVPTASGLQPFSEPRALDTWEIAGVVDRFRSAAANSMRAGFDGIEIHAANAYLIDQFLRDGTNQREDRYGGSIENRARLLLEIVDAVGGVVGRDRLGVRLSPHYVVDGIRDSDPQRLFCHVARALDEMGIAYLHLVEGRGYGTSVTPAPDAAHLLPHMRQAFWGPLVVNGGYDRESAEAVLASGQADMVSFGELFIANPDLPRRFALGAPLNPPDTSSFFTGSSKGYTDYPELGACG